MTDPRLICGDCLEVLPTLPEASVSLILTDPPYGMRKGFAGDWNKTEALAPLRDVLPELRRVLKPNGSVYIFAPPEWSALAEVMVSEQLYVLTRICWVKENGWHHKTCKEDLRSYLSPWE